MGKRHEEPEKESNERWTLTYLDMITLLFCLFVVLYAMSTVDQVKYEQLSESLAEAFSGGNFGIFEMQSGSAGILEGVQKPTLEAKPQAEERRARLLDELRKVMKGNNLKVTEVADGIMITLFSDLNFASGQSNLSEEGYAALRSISPALAEIPNEIRIEGHTDAAPVDAADGFSSNWELSAQRALKVLGALISYGVSEERLSAVAYGSVKPVAANDTPEGRAYNRRVELVVLFDRAE